MNAKPACEIVDMTPAQAQEILRLNQRNRILRRHYVRQLAQAMERGEWMLNGEPIQVASDGTLLNGQHRLHAVVESKRTVRMLMVRDVARDAQRTMDSGSRRNLADVLKLHGMSNTTNLAAAVALLHRYRKKARMESASHSAPTPTEALELLEREPRLIDGVQLACRVYRDAHLRISIAIVLCHLFNEEAGADEGTRFFEALCAAHQQPRGDPLGELRTILARVRDEQTYVLTTYMLCALTIKTFNAWRAGEYVRELRFRQGEKFPVIRANAAAPGLVAPLT
jgi:hypothetical protein